MIQIIQRWKSIDESWRYASVTFLVARLFYMFWSLVIFSIQPVAIQNFELSGEPILSIFGLKDSQVHVYSRQVDGKILTFQPANTEQIIDQQTNSVWNIFDGKAIQGVYKNATLSQAKTSTEDIFPYFGLTPYPGIWLGMWQRFDANWYISIADNGYGHIPGDVHFPPLFPVMMRALKPFFGNTFFAGLLISHVATLFALKLLYDLFKQWGEITTARRALLFFVIYPVSFFLFSSYTESIFLVAALLSVRAMSARSWQWAGFWIFCAILIRLQGIALIVPMLFLMWRDRPFLRKLNHWTGWIIASIAGFLYLYLRSQQATENTLPFVETTLHARLGPPWQSYTYSIETLVTGKATFIDILNLFAATLFFILIIWGWRKIPLEYNIYTLASLLIIMTRIVETQPLMSMSRYTLTLFPAFYVLSLVGNNPWMQRTILYSSILLNLYLTGQFFLWGWVA
jgi:hypothetical protein